MVASDRYLLVRIPADALDLDYLIPIVRALDEHAGGGLRPPLSLWLRPELSAAALVIEADAAGMDSEILAELLSARGVPGRRLRTAGDQTLGLLLAGYERGVEDVQDPWEAVRAARRRLGTAEQRPSRREAVRHRVTPVKSTFEAAGVLVQGEMTDLSLGGCFLRARPPFPEVGAAGPVALAPQEPGVWAEVVYHTLAAGPGDRGPGLALRFLPGDLRQRRLIEDRVAEACRAGEGGRREAARFPATIEIDVHSAGEVRRLLSEDLSTGGVFVHTDDPPEPGEELTLSLSLPGEDEPLHLDATVRHAQREGSHAGAGLGFRAPPAAVARLSRWLGKAEARQDSVVLVADDDAFFRAVVADLLTGAGYRVLEADSGEAALRSVANHVLDLGAVVLDVEMPGLTGGDVLDRIRRAGGELDLPIVICSGQVPEAEERQALRALGANAFIDKGDLEARLLEVVDALALGPEAPSSPWGQRRPSATT